MGKIIFIHLKNTKVQILKNLLLAPFGFLLISLPIMIVVGVIQSSLSEISSLLVGILGFSIIIFIIFLSSVFPFLLVTQLILNHFKLFNISTIALCCIVCTYIFSYLLIGQTIDRNINFQNNLALISFFSIPMAIANGTLAYRSYKNNQD